MIATIALAMTQAALPNEPSLEIETTCVVAKEPLSRFVYTIRMHAGVGTAVLKPIGDSKIPEHAITFPDPKLLTMRAPPRGDGTPNPHDWFIWNAGELPAQAQKTKFHAGAAIVDGKLGDFKFTLQRGDTQIEAVCGDARSPKVAEAPAKP